MLKQVFVALTILAGASESCCFAQDPSTLPSYKPEQTLTPAILRAYGSDDMGPLMKAWEEGFRKSQANIEFTETLKGSHTTMAGLYQGIADLGLSGREAWPLETYGLFRKTHHFATEITVASGSYNVPSKTFALAIFVNKDNPLSKLTVKQLDGIFGKERNGGWETNLNWSTALARGPQENIRTWGQLGVTGEWADKPIHVYGFPVFQPGLTYFFERTVFNGGDIWNPGLRELNTSAEIIDAVSKDPYGIGYTGICYETPAVKAVSLAARDSTQYFAPTRENVLKRQYPLTRSIYIYIDKTPGKPLDPKVKEFLRYVLSKEGQEDVLRGGIYLPLTEQAVQEQLKKLD
jgi:phosphate transport system substrate-binding protein